MYQAHILPFPWEHHGFGSSAAQKQSLSNLCCCQDLIISYCVFMCLLQRWGAAPRQRWWADVCQGEVYKAVSPTHCSHCPPALLTKASSLQGCTRAERKGSPVLPEATCCSAGSSFPVFMLHPLPAQPCFPCYALMPAKEPKPGVDLLWGLVRMLASYINAN